RAHRLQGPHRRLEDGDGRTNARAHRIERRLRGMDHDRRAREHHRSEPAGARRQPRVRADQEGVHGRRRGMTTVMTTAERRVRVMLAADAAGTGPATFLVAGVYEPTPDPRKFSAERLEARLHLPDLIALVRDPADPASAEVVSAINIALKDPRDAERVAAGIA